MTKTQKPMSTRPCPRCLALAEDGALPVEAVMPVPRGAFAAEARDRSGPCCDDCAAADALSSQVPDFVAARIATGNCRLENLRLPEGMRPHFGLVKAGYMKPSIGKDALERHHDWLDKHVPLWADADAFDY